MDGRTVLAGSPVSDIGKSEPELMIVNPMGILITYVRGDRALVTG